LRGSKWRDCHAIASNLGDYTDASGLDKARKRKGRICLKAKRRLRTEPTGRRGE